MPKALIIEPVHPILLTKLSEWGYEYTLVKSISREDAIAVMKDYEGLITSNKLYVDRAIIDAGERLKWIGRMGSGMEIIDVPYAQSKGIHCVSSPEGNANAVAEQALGTLLCLMHLVVKSHQELQHDIWLRDENRGTELFGKKVGIVGYGNNGSLFAAKLMAMGCHVYTYDPYVSITATEQLTPCNSLEELYQHITILSYHVPLNEHTYHYFNATTLNQLKQPIYLLNISRGAIVDLDAVQQGMEQGKIIAAGIDVWEEEPVVNSTNKNVAAFHYLRQHPRTILSAHIGGYSHEATYKMSYYVAQKLDKIIHAR